MLLNTRMSSSTVSQMATTDQTAPSPTNSTAKDVPVRILKKRESDRRCQRIKRERTKTKIAALEEKVRSFGTQDPTGQIQLLMEQLQNVEKERDELAKKVKLIESVIRDGESERSNHIKMSASDDPASTRESSSIAMSFGRDQTEAEGNVHDREQEAEDLTTSHIAGVPNIALSRPYVALSSEATASLVDKSQGVYMAGVSALPMPNRYHAERHTNPICECCAVQNNSSQRPKFNTWRFVNEVLSSRFRWPSHVRMLQDKHRDDTPVRMIVEGWSATVAHGSMHPTWQILQKLDRVLFSNIDQKERLAVVYATQLLLMSHVTPEPLPVPEFYRERPSQNMADNYAIHFFPWPGMRERFVFNQHRYCTNEFWRRFIGGLRLSWPFEFRDCYTMNVETGLYSVSPLFQDRINDIKCWTMDSDVFARWPELRADIPVHNSIPKSVFQTTHEQQSLRATHSDAAPPSPHEQVPRSAAFISTRGQPILSYLQPEATSAIAYHPPPAVYDASDMTIPTNSWSEIPLQQTQDRIQYLVSTAALTNPMMDVYQQP